MLISESKLVVPQQSTPALNVQASVTIAVDTAYVASQQGRNISTGVYMMDNMISQGSSNEGEMELYTVVPVGSVIGFETVPINPASGDRVVITGFTVSQGNVFGSTGYPMIYPAGSSGAYWVGQAMNQGQQTYQVQIAVTVGQIRPVTYYVNWDPFIKAI